MRLFMVTTDLPGTVGGAPTRNFNILKVLAGHGYDIELFSVVDGQVEDQDLSDLSDLGITVHTFSRPHRPVVHQLAFSLMRGLQPIFDSFDASGIGQAVNQAAHRRKPDIIQIEQAMAWYPVRKFVPRWQRFGIRVVLDCHNIEWQALADGLKVLSRPKRLGGNLIIRRYRRFEIMAMRQATDVTTCSPLDQTVIASLGLPATLVSNGIGQELFQVPAIITNEPAIMFMGGTTYPPNDDALRWYLGNIHGRVRQRVPTATLIIIGSQPPQWLKQHAAADPSIRLLGLVPSVPAVLATARVCICPIRLGSGTRLKVLEYMGAGRPVVTTTKGAEGLAYTPNEDLLVADDARAFAAAIVMILNDNDVAVGLGREARRRVQGSSSWEMVTRPLINLYLTKP